LSRDKHENVIRCTNYMTCRKRHILLSIYRKITMEILMVCTTDAMVSKPLYWPYFVERQTLQLHNVVIYKMPRKHFIYDNLLFTESIDICVVYCETWRPEIVAIVVFVARRAWKPIRGIAGVMVSKPLYR